MFDVIITIYTVNIQFGLTVTINKNFEWNKYFRRSMLAEGYLVSPEVSSNSSWRREYFSRKSGEEGRRTLLEKKARKH